MKKAHQSLHLPLVFSRRMFILIVVCAAGLLSPAIHAQTDSVRTVETVKVKRGSIFAGRPGKSLLMSLVIPGTGQIYNKSYWHLPFVYGAIGGVGAILVYDTRQYQCLRDAYKAKIDGVDFVAPKNCKHGDIIETIEDPARLRQLRDQANADRQLAIVGFVLVWLANGIDAYVDAHLKQFDVDDNLSFSIVPKTADDPLVPAKVGLFMQF